MNVADQCLREAFKKELDLVYDRIATAIDEGRTTARPHVADRFKDIIMSHLKEQGFETTHDVHYDRLTIKWGRGDDSHLYKALEEYNVPRRFQVTKHEIQVHIPKHASDEFATMESMMNEYVQKAIAPPTHDT